MGDLIKQFNQLTEKEKTDFLIDLIQEKTKQIDLLQNEMMELSEQNKTWQMISSSDDLIDMSEVAKVLNYKGYGRNKIFQFLRDIEVLRHNNQPYQKYVDMELFKIIEQKIDLPYGDVKINLKTVATQKGIDFIRRKLDEYSNQ
jgi:anti-repressor protein